MPENITLVPLPAYAPELILRQLNPVERVWLFLKERFLSHRLLADYDAVADAASRAWMRLTTEPARAASLSSHPRIPQIK